MESTKLYQIYKLDEKGEKIYFDVCGDTTKNDIEKWANGSSAWLSGCWYDSKPKESEVE